MAKTIWTPGVPTVRGIYWFDTGLRFGWETKKNRHPMVLQVHNSTSEPYLNGDFGGGPLRMYYSEKLCPNAAWSHIEQPDEWGDHQLVKGERGRAWVKHPKGYLGFGLLRPGSHGDVGGSILWLDHPTCCGEHGGWWKSSEGYQFSVVEMPKVK